VRRSRFVEIDGHQVLKLNNYTLEEGERSVYAQEGAAHLARSVPAAKNAYQLFCAEYVLPEEGASGGNKLERYAAAWSALGARGKVPYQRRAKKLKAAHAAARESAFAARGEAAEAETERLYAAQVADDARRVADAETYERAKAKRMKRAREKRSRPATAAVANSVEGRRQAHNRAMKKEAPEKEQQRVRFFSGITDVVAPFVPRPVLRRIPALSKGEQVDFNASRVDTDGAPSIAQPATIVGGEMRRYQLVGLEWMLSMFDHGMNPILADEMGLGKTLQTISFLAALTERGIKGPHLVVVPLSVMSSWMGEFRRWCPSLRVVRLHSQDKAERERMRKEVLADVDGFDVCVTTYEYVKVPEMQRALATRITWRVVVLDEGHKLKNELSGVSAAVRKVRAQSILMLTGTPLQNNMRELWALLNFLYPKIFTDVAPFADSFELNGAAITIDRDVLSAAASLVRPLMLRRMKTEVEKLLPDKVETQIDCPLSPMQEFWYKRLLLKNSAMLAKMEARLSGDSAAAEAAMGLDAAAAGAGAGGDAWKKLNSLMMQLRKCCNHPFLFPGAEGAMDSAVSFLLPLYFTRIMLTI
jgi:SWI/SNF-related matrix-associated actin-dependent regulator of chromatin subfamily A member 5